MSDYFKGVVGQEKAKRKLTLYVDGYRKTSIIPNVIFVGSNGGGKSMIARKTAKALEKDELVEINGSAIKNVQRFMEEIILGKLVGKNAAFFLDELHAAPRGVFNILLSITEPSPTFKNKVIYGDIEAEIDLKLNPFMFATTETQAVFKPLMTRLTPVSLANYDEVDLALILQKYSRDYKVSDDAALALATYTRGTGRSAKLLGDEVARYCAVNDLAEFPDDKISELMDILDVFPLGLTEQEVNVLVQLRNSIGGLTLTALASKTILTKQSQQDVEQYLQKHELMKIDGTRQITAKGREYLKNIGR